MNHSIGYSVKSVFNIYENLDKHIENFKSITGLKCPEGCGACCENPKVEASVLELLPLAQEIYLLGKEGQILDVLDSRIKQGYSPCILFTPDQESQGNGKCLFYHHRPLICRLFGFASRKNKYNEIEFTPCKVINQNEPHLAQRTQIAISNNIVPPVYQQSAIQVASVLPSMGFRRFPINRAIYEALAQFQWRKPVKPRRKKVA